MDKEITDITVKLSLVSFKDDNCFILYLPELNIIGFGDTKKEAQDSFKICLEEFFRSNLEKSELFING